MKVQLLSSINGMKSGSLKRVALALSKAVSYKVWRTTKKRMKRKQFLYGDLVDKLTQYKFFQEKGLSALEFTASREQAEQWLIQGHTVFGRKTLTGSEGKGIVVFTPEEQDVTSCPVYTKYKPKKREFRVHIFKDKVVGVVEKRQKKDWNGPKNPKIRNTANGFVFCQDVELTPELRKRIEEVSLLASTVCKSDFRGVDVGFNEKHDDLFIIEVNSAPGIEGSNVDKYIQVIKQYV